MKFHRVNVHAVERMIPRWFYDYFTIAREIDRILVRTGINVDPDAQTPFLIEMDLNAGDIRIATAETEIEQIACAGRVLITRGLRQVQIPLQDILKGCQTQGTHCVYLHCFALDVPTAYVGISSRPWYVRYAEHERSAKNGSRFLFHEALRRHTDVRVQHRVLFGGLHLHWAMKFEEEIVEMLSLYPLGLNMIPGGYAGLRYLSSIGQRHKSSEHVAEVIASEMERPSIEGRPNPLCAARWESDPDYAARVICGHSGRLTVEQVQMARAMAIAGHGATAIRTVTGARNDAQILRLLRAKTYARVA